jgi:hypothetical protein
MLLRTIFPPLLSIGSIRLFALVASPHFFCRCLVTNFLPSNLTQSLLRMSHVLFNIGVDVQSCLVVDVRACSSTFEQRSSNSSVRFEVFHRIALNLRRGECAQ